MKIPEEQKCIFEMLKYNGVEACEMAYEIGYVQGKIDTLKENLKELEAK
jgi:hypothetical protein